MDQAPKQERSRKRIEVILTTAENILLENGIDSVTIATVSYTHLTLPTKA